ncbi:DUF192 domain-containing protein [Streptomyces antioxidans]|uniref:DUF192 domain-containing protein n=1 Tax=Streptomyces antioxidans TaxID=1507734 RepID=UPI000A9B4F32
MGRWRDGTGTLRVVGGAGGGLGDGPNGAKEDPGGAEGRAGRAGGCAERGAGRAEDGAGRAAGGAGRAEGIPLTIAASYRARARGLLGRDGLTGALLLTPASGVHTFRMRFAIDVAYLDRRLTVLDVHTLRPGRLGRPRLRSRHVLEAEAGALERWGVRRGVRVVIAPGPSAPPPSSVR